MHTPNIDMKEINELITYKIKHTYLNQYISKPVMNQTKLSTLAIIINQTHLPVKIKKQYIIATTLIQIALDTHDLVPITDEGLEDESAITTKQLTVLAGDYYSGLYYLLLAEIEDIPLISHLATTIKELTEHKMKLYYGEYDNFNECIEAIKKVETMLITGVARFVNQSMLIDITEKLIMTSLFIEEKKQFLIQDQSPILDDLYTNLKTKSYSSILASIDQEIEVNIRQIEERLAQLELHEPVIKSEFQSICNEFVYNNISVAEEG